MSSTSSGDKNAAVASADDSIDDWQLAIQRGGCAQENAKLQDCHDFTRDWRRCRFEVIPDIENTGLTCSWRHLKSVGQKSIKQDGHKQVKKSDCRTALLKTECTPQFTRLPTSSCFSVQKMCPDYHPSFMRNTLKHRWSVLPPEFPSRGKPGVAWIQFLRKTSLPSRHRG